MMMQGLRPALQTSRRRFTCASARNFSVRSALQKEIQDAYILSASRTPTAKVSLDDRFHEFMEEFK